MEAFAYHYEKDAMLLDKLYVMANFSEPYLWDDMPRYTLPELAHFQEAGDFRATSLGYDVFLTQYRNEKEEVLYGAEKGPPGIFRLGKLSERIKEGVVFGFIDSETDSDVSLRFQCTGCMKIFLNGTFLAMDSQTVDRFFRCRLKSGRNLLVFECYSITSASEISVRISDLQSEEAYTLYSLEYGNCSEAQTVLSVHIEGNGNADELSYFAYMTDHLLAREQLRVEGVYLDADMREIGTFEPRLNEKVAISPKKSFDCMPVIPVVTMRFTAWQGEKLICKTEKRIFVGDVTVANEQILAEAEMIIREKRYSAYDRFVMKCCVEAAHQVEQTPESIWTQTCYIRTVLKHLQSGMRMEDIYRLPGAHNIYFRNPLDGRTDRYSILVPDGYDCETACPLIVNIDNEKNENHYIFYERNADQGIIFADFYLKGLTLGSYVGEAEFFVLLRDIWKRYLVDKRRIYLTGGCNGAYAALTLAQNYPHIFAGVFSASGMLYEPAIRNLTNVFIMNVHSDSDLLYGSVKRRQCGLLEQMPSVMDVPLRACTHSMLMKSMQRRTVAEELVRHVSEPYPRDIWFHTERNCHCKSFWVELLGISRGSHYAEIEVHADSSTIVISCANADGIRLKLPPYVRRKGLQIRINQRNFLFDNVKGSNLIFLCDGTQWTVASKAPAADSLKGTGLIDAYRRKLEVVCDTNDPSQMRVANALAHPATMGFRTEILIQYPILDRKRFRVTNKNILWIRRFDQPTPYDPFLSVRIGENDITYQGQTMQGNYVVLEAVTLPKKGNVLWVITYQDAQMLPRLLFLRKMILPGYCNGTHPFLNQRILVFDGEWCRAAYEEGDKLLRLSGKNAKR